MPGIGHGIGIPFAHKGFQWSTYWATLISATVEPAAPTNVVLTFAEANAQVTASDFTIAGFTVNSGSWTDAVLTLVLEETVTTVDNLVVTFVKSGETANVTNKIYPTWFTPTAANNVLMVGDSFMRGSGASNELTLSFQALINDALKTRLGDAGDGCYWARYTTTSYSYNWLQWSGDFTSASNVINGMLGFAATGLSTGKYWEITVNGKYFDLVHTVSVYNIKFEIYLDDVLYETITRARYSNDPGMYYVERITAATYGSHKIKIVSVTIAEPLQLICYSGNNGINQILCGVAGAGTLTYVPAAAADSFIYQCAIITPAVTIIELGYNDYLNQVALEDFEARLTIMVNAGLAHGSVFVVNNTDYDPGKTITIADYNTRIAAICTATGATLIDMATVFGTAANALSNGWIVSAANWHPTDAGHQKFYETIYAAIMAG